ncbi:MAG: M24 family metallopeptidase [Myxococcales bacterium]|nr:M24 family metallopeptidase [Myxococcales bacterium]
MRESSSQGAGLASVRATLEALQLDGTLVRGTDRYLNEYVPRAESTREWLTGFSGSLGDALVSRDAAWLFVDGRYHVQADREVDLAAWTVVKNNLGTSNEAAAAETLISWARAAGRRLRVGYEPERYSLATFEGFAKLLAGAEIELVAVQPGVTERARGPMAPTVTGQGGLRVLDDRAMGRTVAEKQALVAAWLDDKRADALVVSRLDELAWLTNLRAQEMPYQATFRGAAVVTATTLTVAVDVLPVDASVRGARPGVTFVAPEALFPSTLGGAVKRVAVDPASVSVATRQALEAMGLEVLSLASPIAPVKARKTPAELDAMKRAFARADDVVAASQAWLEAQVREGAQVSEVDFAREVERRFLAAGATHLSFKVISAFGKNGAVVHHPPSAEAMIAPGDLMLLDTGCYFEEGFATDLTRTFFVGAPGQTPTEAQRRLYTLVLKAAIAGMSARLPKGAVGAQLDGITRAPLWREGLDYAHGTGHGVGINVHESPPGIGKTSLLSLEPGHVFSIEPGLYLEGVGGVRIENLCTVVESARHPNMLDVVPLTFAPLDQRLIDASQLDAHERAFVEGFTRPA